MGDYPAPGALDSRSFNSPVIGSRLDCVALTIAREFRVVMP